MAKQKPEIKSLVVENVKKNALVSASAGCLTVVVAGAALLVGLLIDARLGTAPKWTLILVIASAPFTLGGVYLIVRRALKRSREEIGQGEGDETDAG
jgi:F0F1-type ATP synthase assembly protein I